MKTCENCGCRVYALGCVNCNEEAYMREAEEREAEQLRHDNQCETELTSHGYTPCRCEERLEKARFGERVCNCGRPYYRYDTLTDECESCYELRRSI